MTSLRKVVIALAVLILAAIAGPSLAGTGPVKSYSIEYVLSCTDSVNQQSACGQIPSVNPTLNANGQVNTPVKVFLTLKNESPPSGGANSNIGSFTVYFVGVTISSVDPPPSGNVTWTGNTVTVTKMGPLQAQQTFTLALNVNSCGDGTIPLTLVDGLTPNPQVFTGSQLTGQTFTPFDLDQDFPTARTLSTLTYDGLAVAGDSLAPSVATSGITCGSFASCSNTSVTVPVAGINCTSTSTDPRCLTVIQNLDKIGVCEANLNYFVTNMIVTQDQLHFRWPDTNPSFSAFKYKINTPGPLAPTPTLGWLDANGNFANSDDPTAVAVPVSPTPVCLSANLPSQYATLAAAVPGGPVAANGTIQVNLSIPNGKLPATPFPIVIANGTSTLTATGAERMKVTQTSGNGTWQVVRCDGMTCDLNTAPSHSATLPVVSSPLPLLPAQPAGSPYVQGEQALGCIAVQPTQNKDKTWSYWVIDIGPDSWSFP